ncbi:MAG: 4'-phosphopantetheinyl transferase [Aestuariibacter sp.]
MLDPFILKPSIISDPVFAVIFASCSYDIDEYSENLFSAYDIEKVTELENAVPKRKAEYLAGRYMAKLALQELQITNTQVPIGKHRAPVWPAKTLGSISHTCQMAMCAVAEESQWDYLGIDIENKFNDEYTSLVKNKLIKANEEAYLSSLDTDFNLLLTAVFSAKEALFKALYPSVGEYFGFESAQVRELDVRKQTLTLTLTRDLCKQALQGSNFNVKFTLGKSDVQTLVIGKFSPSGRSCNEHGCRV